MWFIGVEVEQETSAPLLTKILDPPLKEASVSAGNKSPKTFVTDFLAGYKLCSKIEICHFSYITLEKTNNLHRQS